MDSCISLVLSENHDISDDCLKLTNKIKGALFDIAHSFVYIGFLLAECDYFKSYEQWGYSSIHEYAFEQFGFKKSSTYNFINVCKVFSINSSTDKHSVLPFSMNMKDSYKDFNFSQLVEMLSLNEKQREKVSSDMSVREIKLLKKNDNVDSRRLEEAPAPEVPSDVDYIVPHQDDVSSVFDKIEDAFLDDTERYRSLFDIASDFFKDNNYIILKKV